MSDNESIPLDWLDRPLWGAAQIARVVNLVDKDGRLRTRAAFHLLKNRRLDADKIGGIWTSTPRRLLRSFSGNAA